MLAIMAAMAVQAMAGATPPAACPVPVLPAELAGWRAQVPLTAAARGDDAPRATVTIGTGARVTLSPQPRVAYPLAPAKPGTPAQFGGIVAFVAPAAGRYRVALGAAAWVDVVRDGRAVASAAHGHGGNCSPARKLVDFDLLAGRYTVQLAGSDRAVLPMMVARVAR